MQKNTNTLLSNLQKRKSVKKSELHRVTDTNADSCSSSSSSVANTIQDFTVTPQLCEDKVDDDTTPDESLIKEDKNIVRCTGNDESISISSVEFVDLVSGKCN